MLFMCIVNGRLVKESSGIYAALGHIYIYIYIFIVCCHGNIEQMKGLNCDIYLYNMASLLLN